VAGWDVVGVTRAVCGRGGVAEWCAGDAARRPNQTPAAPARSTTSTNRRTLPAR
jgi:hypothetical protein